MVGATWIYVPIVAYLAVIALLFSEFFWVIQGLSSLLLASIWAYPEAAAPVFIIFIWLVFTYFPFIYPRNRGHHDHYDNSAISRLEESDLIRLLDISDELNMKIKTYKVRMLRHIDYVALSYTWEKGTPEEERYLVTINDKPVRIRYNLFCFFKAMESERSVSLIFVDALCINQRDEKEKAMQIQHMKSIYQNAQKVLIWLSLEQERKSDFSGNTSFVNKHHAIRRLSVLDDPGPTNFPDDPDIETSEALGWIYSHHYWSRLWIVQEVLLAQDIDVFCHTGGRSHVKLSWSTLARFWLDYQSLLRKKRIYIPKDGSIEYAGRIFFAKERWDGISYGNNLEFLEALFSRDQTSDLLENFRQTWERSGGGIPIYQALLVFGNQQCEDRRDLVYGMLGLVDDPSSIQPDYRLPLAQVCRSAVEQSIRRMHADLKRNGFQGRRNEYDRLYTRLIDIFNLSRVDSDRIFVAMQGVSLSMIETSGR